MSFWRWPLTPPLYFAASAMPFAQMLTRRLTLIAALIRRSARCRVGNPSPHAAFALADDIARAATCRRLARLRGTLFRVS